MRSLLKRKSEATPVVAPAWHPNFRNFERLPDTKVVRTAFFINGIALMAALVALLWFAYQEYQLHALRRQVAEVQAQIDRDRGSSERAIATYKKFQEAAARVNEVNTFVKSKPRLSELLLRLAETLPGNIALDGFEIRETVLNIRGTVRGAPDQASGYASTYLQQLRADPVLGPKFDEIVLVDLSRNAQTGRLALEIALKFKGAREAKKR